MTSNGMDYGDAKKRILAAQALLLEPSSSYEKFSAVKNLLKGVNPQLDSALERCEQDLGTVQKILGNDFFSFAAENLPEATEEQKQRKKAVLFFWKTWNTLRSEVARVQAEMQAAQNSPDQVQQASHWGRIINFAKGPFGIVTVVAVGLVSASAYTSVDINIHNKGCDTMVPSASMPIPIPGISFPKDPIEDGATGKAALPALPITIDGTGSGVLVAKLLTVTMSFQLGDVSDVTFDGVSLKGKVTSLNLSEKKSHDLVFFCQ